MKKPLVQVACAASIICFFAMIVLVVLLFVLEQIVQPPDDFKGFSWAQPVAIFLMSIFLISILALWLEAWTIVIRGWKLHSPWFSFACIAFLIVGPVFAAYTFHFLKKRYLQQA
jgi:hypothetical protein